MSENDSGITVVTVNYNNAHGLRRTLSSLACLNVKPARVIIIDANSSDDSIEIANLFASQLNLDIHSEPDDGIYFGMNKGKHLVNTSLIHYLNSGDEVYGEPYQDVETEACLEVTLRDENGKRIGIDKRKLFGYGYNHQGIIFSSNHVDYDCKYSIAADSDLIVKHFPNGLHALPMLNTGGVNYYLGGFSSKNMKQGNIEILRIFYETKISMLPKVFSYIFLKSFIPRRLKIILLRFT